MSLREDIEALVERVEELEERVEELEGVEPNEKADDEPMKVEFGDQAAEQLQGIIRAEMGAVRTSIEALVTRYIQQGAQSVVDRMQGEVRSVFRAPRVLEQLEALIKGLETLTARHQQIASERTLIASKIRAYRPRRVADASETGDLARNWAPLMNDLADALINGSL